MTFEQELVFHSAALRSRCLNICRDRDRADDLAQDVMVRALRAKDTFTPGTNMRAWLFTIARNEFLTGYRKNGRVLQDVDDMLARTVPSDDDLQAALEAKDAIAHLADIPIAQVRVLMASASGLSLDDIAARENIPVGTVKSRVFRARARLAELLGEKLTITSDVVVA